jgi:hypothetical protein
MFQPYKKLFIGVLVFFVSASLIWFALFEYGKNWLKTEIIRAEADLRQKGYEISCSNLEFKGTPWSIEAIVQNPHLKDPQGFMDWHGEKMKVMIRPWNFNTFIFTLPGNQRLFILKNPLFGALSLEGAQGTLKLNSQNKLNEASVFIDKLVSMKEGSVRPLVFYSLSFKAENIASFTNVNLLFKSSVKGFEPYFKEKCPKQPLDVDLKAHLSGYQGKNPVPLTLAEWRDGGGVLEIDFAKVTWQPIVFEAEGTLTYDKDLYPLGSFSTRIIGHQEALSHMIELGCMNKNNAMWAGFALDLLSKQDEKGNKVLSVPLTLQDRRLSLGAIPLLKMGE